MAPNIQDLKSALTKVLIVIFFPKSFSQSGSDIHLSDKENKEMPLYVEL